MVDVERQARLVGGRLQLYFPESDAAAVRATAVGRNGEFGRLRIPRATHTFEPAADRGDGELRRVAGDADRCRRRLRLGDQPALAPTTLMRRDFALRRRRSRAPSHAVDRPWADVPS